MRLWLIFVTELPEAGVGREQAFQACCRGFMPVGRGLVVQEGVPVSWAVVLDSGALGLLTNPKTTPAAPLLLREFHP